MSFIAQYCTLPDNPGRVWYNICSDCSFATSDEAITYAKSVKTNGSLATVSCGLRAIEIDCGPTDKINEHGWSEPLYRRKAESRAARNRVRRAYRKIEMKVQTDDRFPCIVLRATDSARVDEQAEPISIGIPVR